MKLKAVKITKTTSCLTYALKRVGLEHLDISDSRDVDEYFDRIPIDDLYLNLEIGDLMLFANKERIDIVPMEITEDGKIISKPTMILRHIGVYEGDGLISDCGISSKNFPFCKHVRMRHYSEISDEDKPTHLLKLKKEYQPVKSVAHSLSTGPYSIPDFL